MRRDGDPAFVYGVEFSCEDEEGKYHVLGYGYDARSASMRDIVHTFHTFRMNKVMQRLDFLEKELGFPFSSEDKEALLSLSNPGKPHIANMMVRYGYAATKDEAIEKYINRFRSKEKRIRPETAIQAILQGGGIPVLAHPAYGSGDELIIGDAMERRLAKLMRYGLRGVEAFYSGFSQLLQNELLALADHYGLYVTAGSDYHGTNKLVRLGDTNLDTVAEYPEGLCRFVQDITK